MDAITLTQSILDGADGLPGMLVSFGDVADSVNERSIAEMQEDLPEDDMVASSLHNAPKVPTLTQYEGPSTVQNE